MKNYFPILASVILSLGLAPAYSQFGQISDMATLGENTNFSANIEMHLRYGDGDFAMSYKCISSDGKSRIEMDLAQMKGKPPKGKTLQSDTQKSDEQNKLERKARNLNIASKAAYMGQHGVVGGLFDMMADWTVKKLTGQEDKTSPAIMKLIGKMTIIFRPDKKINYLIYPGIKSYVEIPSNENATNKEDATKIESDHKPTITELGKEAVDDHACIKNKVTITDKDGNPHESTVWNATDLKQFPIKVEAAEQDITATILFKDLSLEKPDDSLFDPPADFKKYDSLMLMLQQEVIKKIK